MADPLSSDFYKTNDATKDTAIPRFYMAAHQLTAESEKEGHAVYEDREFLEIRMPGDRSYNFITQVTDEYRKRFPAAYAAFKTNQAQAVEGTPIEMWPPLTPSQVLNFKAMNILSVEDLATIPDGQLHMMGMGARDLRAKAMAWLANARDNASAMRFAKETESLKDELGRRDELIAQLTARLDALEAKRTKRAAE